MELVTINKYKMITMIGEDIYTSDPDNRIFVHRYNVIKYIGRDLGKTEHVHHLDFDRANNDISNLILLSNSEHLKLHMVINDIDFIKTNDFSESLANIPQPNVDKVEELLNRKLTDEEDYYSFIENQDYLYIGKIILFHKAFRGNLLNWLSEYKRIYKQKNRLGLINSTIGIKTCPICNIKIDPGYSFCSLKCTGINNKNHVNRNYVNRNHVNRNISNRKVERPSKEELYEMIKTTPMVTIGKKYGVADNTIRKWCKGYGIPFKSREFSSTVTTDQTKGVIAEHYFTKEIRKYISVAACAKDHSIDSSSFSRLLRDKQKDYVHKDSWRFKYADDPNPIKGIEYSKLREFGAIKPLDIVTINNETNVVNIYNSLASCSNMINIPTTSLARYLKDKESCTYKNYTITRLSTYLAKHKPGLRS